VTQPVRVLAPEVIPVNVPPAAGTTVGAAHALPAGIVDDVVLVLVVVTVVPTTVEVVTVVVVTVVVVMVEVVVVAGGMTTGTVATLFDSFSSAMRPNGSMRTRSV
jgi:hypothetical protein